MSSDVTTINEAGRSKKTSDFALWLSVHDSTPNPFKKVFLPFLLNIL